MEVETTGTHRRQSTPTSSRRTCPPRLELPRAGDAVEGHMLTRCISRPIRAPIELEPSRRVGQLTWFGGAAARASSTARRSGSGRLGLEQSGDWRWRAQCQWQWPGSVDEMKVTTTNERLV